MGDESIRGGERIRGQIRRSHTKMEWLQCEYKFGIQIYYSINKLQIEKINLIK